MAAHIKAIHPMKYMRDFLARNVRPDGRDLHEVRSTAINVASITSTDGSAIVKLGNTVVICGIKAELTTPNPEEPDKGMLVPHVELPPLCSSRFKTGPPGEEAQVYNQFMAEALINSECVDCKQLCIIPDKLAWVLYCDMVCLDYDGSVLDACVAALAAALRTVSLPEVQYDPINKSKKVLVENKKPLKLTDIPIASTFATFDEDTLLTDPTGEEEDLSQGTVTIITSGDRLCCVHKPGGCRISEARLQDCINKAYARAKLVTKMIDTSIETLQT